MYQSKLMYTLLLSALLSCEQPRRSREFSAFVSSLPVLQTPLQFRCGLSGPFETNKWGADSLIFSRFSFGDVVAGRLYSDDHFITLLCGDVGDDAYPSLHTFTSDGVLIDSADMSGDCFGDHGYLSVSVANINTNRTVVVLDTTWTVQFDQSDNEIPNTDSTRVHVRLYRLTDSGRFVTLKDSTSIRWSTVTGN